MQSGMTESQQQVAGTAEKTLLPEVKARPPQEAAALLAEYPADVIAGVLLDLNPALSQDILQEFPRGLADAVMQAVSPVIAMQWERNATYPQGTVGRLMEPVIAVFRPQQTVGETIEQLRHLIKTAFITYGYVIDAGGRLIGIITMRDLLFAAHETRLDALMLRDLFFLKPDLPLNEAMKLVLDRHYPVYPVCDENGVLIGLVRGQAMFEEQAFEITAQAGTMVGVEKEERLATPWSRQLQVPPSVAAVEPAHRVRRRRGGRHLPGHRGPARDTGAVPAGARRAVGQHRLPGARRDAARHHAGRAQGRARNERWC